jgi:hypothetical protein
MGRKSRKKRESRLTLVRKVKSDEAFQYGPLSVERYGRYLRLSNTASPEEHERLLDYLKVAHTETRKALEAQILDFQRRISNYDPLILMYRAVYMVLSLFIKYRHEWEYEGEENLFLPGSEYLQYLISRTEFGELCIDIGEEEWEGLWAELIGVLDATNLYLLTRAPSKKTDPVSERLRSLVDGHRLGIRGKRYQCHQKEHLDLMLAPYEPWLLRLYGSTAEELISGLLEIADYQRTGLLGLYRELANAIEDLKTSESDSTETGVDLSKRVAHVEELAALVFTPRILDITDLTSLPKEFLADLSIMPGESPLTAITGENHDDLSPLSNSPLHRKPFLEIDRRFFVTYHSGLHDYAAELIEAKLLSAFPEAADEMYQRRSDRSEAVAVELLTRTIKPDFVYRNVFYPNPERPGTLTEIDAIMGIDDRLILVEVKGGGLSAGAQRGAPQELLSELRDLIIKGHRQSERAADYIQSSQEVPFFDGSGRREVCVVKSKTFRRTIRVVVTREQIGWVGAQLHILSNLDSTLVKSYPWHVSIDDLRVVSDLFHEDELQFIHYLEERLAATTETDLKQYDELDHIGLYFCHNQYWRLPIQEVQFTYHASVLRRIDNFFIEKTLGHSLPPPSQKLPPTLVSLLGSLRDGRLPGRTAAACTILSMNEDGRRTLGIRLADIVDPFDGSRTKGVRMPCREARLGISISNFDPSMWREEVCSSGAQMKQSGCETWVIVRLARKDRIEVAEIRLIDEGTLEDYDVSSAQKVLEERVLKVISSTKIGRNQHCPCGSRLKFKGCHGRRR